MAIDDVSIDIEEGTFFAIVGPSGCGKTTLLRILGGLETVTSGEVEIADPAPGRPQYSMIFQGDSIFPWMTVWDNAAYGLRMRKAPKAEIERRWRAGSIAPGSRALRISIRTSFPAACASACRSRAPSPTIPEVLLMDEPFSALDEQNRTILQQELLRIWEVDKKTVVFITHSVDEAVTLADKIMVMTASPGRAKSHHRRRRSSARATCSNCATIRATARSSTASGATSRTRSSARGNNYWSNRCATAFRCRATHHCRARDASFGTAASHCQNGGGPEHSIGVGLPRPR